MNRTTYFNYIEEKMNFLVFRIAQRGRLNLLELNIHSESFFSDLINIIFDYKLINMNDVKQNIEGIDLLDETNEITAQVSSTCTKQKIEHSLEKNKYSKFGFKFIVLGIASDTQRNNTFENPNDIKFSPKNDIIDIKDILSRVLNLNIRKQKEVYELIKKELFEENTIKLDSNLTSIINIIANENLNEGIESPSLNTFEIKRKIEFNGLSYTEEIINDYGIYYQRTNDIYNEFDMSGKNKSTSVLQKIKKIYLSFQDKDLTSDALFLKIIDQVIQLVCNSKNYIEIPYEELEMCVSIVTVDAFIKCKIFKNPENYTYVVTK